MSSLMAEFVNNLKNPSQAQVVDHNGTKCVRLLEAIKGTNSCCSVLFCFEEDSKDVQIMFLIENVRFPHLNYNILKQLNTWNYTFKSFVFCVNDSNSFIMKSDVLLASDVSVLMYYAFVGIGIVEEIFPNLMKLLWD